MFCITAIPSAAIVNNDDGRVRYAVFFPDLNESAKKISIRLLRAVQWSMLYVYMYVYCDDIAGKEVGLFL